MRLTPQTIFFAAPSTILIVKGLVEIYADVFVRNDFISTKVQYIWVGIIWAFIGYLIKDFNLFKRFPLFSFQAQTGPASVQNEFQFSPENLNKITMLLAAIAVTAFGLWISYDVAVALVLIIFCYLVYLPRGSDSVTASNFEVPLPSQGTEDFNAQLNAGQNDDDEGALFQTSQIPIVGPVLLLLTLFLPWSIGTSQSDIGDVEAQVEIAFTGSQLFQINSLVMVVVIASVAPIIQYAVKKSEEFPMLPTVCFGIVALCDLLLFNDIRASSVDFDLGEAGRITGNAAPGSGLILNLIMSALLAFFSFQAQTESDSVQNESSYEKEHELRVPKKVVKKKSSVSLANELNKLNELKEQGILDDDEFKAAKTKLLK